MVEDVSHLVPGTYYAVWRDSLEPVKARFIRAVQHAHGPYGLAVFQTEDGYQFRDHANGAKLWTEHVAYEASFKAMMTEQEAQQASWAVHSDAMIKAGLLREGDPLPAGKVGMFRLNLTIEQAVAVAAAINNL